ncbi:hypothetical protein PFTANZ_03971 [Plasmodium falciparum Tanzania (2000708)]|uniref:Transmembrane protein n=1 Tax=Plasmodium falciparum Tanzania (2000708) TaxID=1036725 RepID=A0A024W464_PLAFA|nr:hypothetical protein PFTANZ_03971 [Plasmodium falciparum Tanzania (2000708)]
MTHITHMKNCFINLFLLHTIQIISKNNRKRKILKKFKCVISIERMFFQKFSSELLMDLNLFYIHLVIFLQYIFIENTHPYDIKFYNKNISYYYIKLLLTLYYDIFNIYI